MLRPLTQVATTLSSVQLDRGRLASSGGYDSWPCARHLKSVHRIDPATVNLAAALSAEEAASSWTCGAVLSQAVARRSDYRQLTSRHRVSDCQLLRAGVRVPRTKNNHSHAVPLNDTAYLTLKRLYKDRDPEHNSPYLFVHPRDARHAGKPVLDVRTPSTGRSRRPGSRISPGMISGMTMRRGS
jgi:hypothetical protein